jgi:hypothetical protein
MPAMPDDHPDFEDLPSVSGGTATVADDVQGRAGAELARRSVLQWELEQQQAVLRVLEANLVAREADLTGLLDAVATFGRRYHEVLGGRYARLAELASALAELRGKPLVGGGVVGALPPAAAGDPTGGSGSGSAAEGAQDGRRRPESARRLFRRLARRIHPDLARSAAERQRRTQFMMAANRAYEQGDVARLRQLLEDWELGPDAVVGSGPEADLERLARRIEQARRRLAAIGTELGELEASHLGALYRQAEEASGLGLDLLADMAAELDRVIERTEAELRAAAV